MHFHHKALGIADEARRTKFQLTPLAAEEEVHSFDAQGGRVSHWNQLDLSVLSLRELKQLYQRIGQEVSKRQEEGRRWLHEHSRGLVEKRGPIYRNPHNSAETWSGRGKQPDWVAQALGEGHSLESLTKDLGALDDFLPMKAGEESG